MRNGQILIFDADDTLWENNVLFERVIDSFLDWSCEPGGRVHARAVLDEIEAANVVAHGYGATIFQRSLRDCRERLLGRAPTAEDLARIAELVAPLARQDVELIPGVRETLTELADRHDLLMLTKGDPAEQQRKVDASDLAHHFRSVHIVAEKDVDTYRGLADSLGLPHERTWMIGNSPKSDIIPARRAGLNTVFIPHKHTWVLEHADFLADEATLRLGGFRELVDHF